MAKGKMYIPQSIFELLDALYSMHLNAPEFKDQTGYLPFMNLDYVFRQFLEGLAANRQRLGDEQYQTLKRMSDEARALFEADANNTTGETTRGRDIIAEMIQILRPTKQPLPQI